MENKASESKTKEVLKSVNTVEEVR